MSSEFTPQVGDIILWQDPDPNPTWGDEWVLVIATHIGNQAKYPGSTNFDGWSLTRSIKFVGYVFAPTVGRSTGNSEKWTLISRLDT